MHEMIYYYYFEMRILSGVLNSKSLRLERGSLFLINDCRKAAKIVRKVHDS